MAAYERYGNGLRCKEHGETFRISHRCPQCPKPDNSGRGVRGQKRRYDAKHTANVARTAAASFDGHPLGTREGRIAAVAMIYDAIPKALQQPEMNAVKEKRQCIALAEQLCGIAETLAEVKSLRAEVAELRAVVSSVGESGPEPPLIAEMVTN